MRTIKAPTLNTKKGTLTLVEPGIVKFQLKENIEWNLEDAKETHAANLSLNKGEKFCMYMNTSRFFIPTKEAQLFVASKECTDYRIGVAFITKNIGLRLFANLYIKFFKSKRPARLFSNEAEAFKWMRGLLKKEI